MEKRMNQGFEIINAIVIDEETKSEVVLGKNETRFGTQYVTWLCKGFKDYYWGHYKDDLKSAKIDFCERALEELRYYQ